MFIDNRNLAYTLVHCVDEDCSNLGNLKDFITEESINELFNPDIDDFDFDNKNVIEVQCVCPSCGRKFKAEISRHFDYDVNEKEE